MTTLKVSMKQLRWVRVCFTQRNTQYIEGFQNQGEIHREAWGDDYLGSFVIIKCSRRGWLLNLSIMNRVEAWPLHYMFFKLQPKSGKMQIFKVSA